MLKGTACMTGRSVATSSQLLACNGRPAVARAARRSPSRGSSSSGAPALAAAAPARQQLEQRRRRSAVARAKKTDDETFERMKREADGGGDIWGSEIVATVLKVGLVAAFVTVAVLLLDVAQPIVETTIERFPKP